MTRAKIPTPSVLCSPGGEQPQMYNPNFEVEHQMEPTPENPVPQHKIMAGYGGGAGSLRGPRTKRPK